MPIISLSIQQQLQAVSSGIKVYPDLSGITKDGIFIDQFNRVTLNPTGAYQIYGTAVINSGAVAMSDSNLVNMSTGTTISSTVRFFGDELSLERLGLVPDLKTVVEINIWFNSATTQTNKEFFIGVTEQNVTLAGVPTTQRHAGVIVNTASSNNLILSSGNGSAQSTSDTGTAIDGTVYRINIVWITGTTAEIALFNLAGTQIGSTLTGGDFALDSAVMQNYLENLSAADTDISIFQWSIGST